MRIWIINHYAAPENGTVGVRHAVLSRRLAEAGHDVTVFTASTSSGLPGGGAAARVARRGFADTSVNGVTWRIIKSRNHRNRAERLVGMWDFGRRIDRSLGGLPCPDVVIGSCVHPFAVEAARRVGRRLGVPFVYEIRDIWPQSLIDIAGMSRWHPVCLAFRRLERRAFRDAAGVITLFPGMRPYVQAHGVDAGRMCYVPNGIDVSRYPRVPLRPRTGPFIYSFFGSHGPVNDLANTLLAARRVQQACGDRLQIRYVGDGPLKPALVRQAESLGLTNVSFRPPVGKEELKRLAAASDAFLYSHKRMPVIEQYGLSANKLYDYLVGGRPIVFSCTSFNNPVEEAGAGVSTPAGEPDRLADAMIDLAGADDAARQAMADRGRRYAATHHDLPKLAERLATFLQRVVANPAGGSGRCIAVRPAQTPGAPLRIGQPASASPRVA